jgi:DNA-binding GntR family transcriptional regulator
MLCLFYLGYEILTFYGQISKKTCLFFYSYYNIRNVEEMMTKSDSFINIDKNELKRIPVTSIDIDKPDLKNIFEAKSVVIANWLIDWIKKDFKAGKIREMDLLPKKAELAYHLGVSIGTIQNSLRYIEDKGYVESKQCIGTFVKDWTKQTSTVRKLTSKREVTINLIKKYLAENKFKIGQILPSSRVLASLISSSPNTTRLALENLSASGILEHQIKEAGNSCWVLKSKDFYIDKSVLETCNETLVEKVQKDLELYITKNLSVGEKIPPHDVLARELKVSIKTIHGAFKNLIKSGILLARRGRYGTTVIKMPNESALAPKLETSIFASAKDTAFYNYEKTQNHIKRMIAENYEIGERLPSIMALSKDLDLSPNTIRKAFNNLSREGYLRFERGRYGGTFVVDIPEITSQSFKWLAVNPKYVEAYKGVSSTVSEN